MFETTNPHHGVVATVLLDFFLTYFFVVPERGFPATAALAAARPDPQMLSNKWTGWSLSVACMASPSRLVPNTDFQK